MELSKMKKPRLIVAMDVGTLAEVREITDSLAGLVDAYKVGSELFTACGPAAVRFIQAKGKDVFLDLKYHDIPNTVASAVKMAVGLSSAVERTMDIPPGAGKPKGLLMFTVHTSGGLEMMQAAVAAAQESAEKLDIPKPLVVGVTVLTSEEKRDNILALVLERALLARRAGLDGVVASCEEAKFIRKEFGPDFVIVTPGIRPEGSDAQDQKRVATPREAVLSGSNFLVVGRPILKAPNPKQAAKQILEAINSL
ncbi:MAG: orotidine-5'-phosphate decarboxylase [Candidatus Omnitrophota bacterium]|nr:orotidine-5'-phosphate decarboxylase [Candidatus Omnitrophota bacterium]MDZ4242482.1 orotidine-5'-phosphate decarboxylase [Candidatus Omnitrophota bacterium]